MNVLLVVIFISVVVSGVILGWTMMIRSSRNKGQSRDSSSDASIGASGPSEPPK
jgi:type II secretory pathway component PulK